MTQLKIPCVVKAILALIYDVAFEKQMLVAMQEPSANFWSCSLVYLHEQYQSM
jgi:hypothetical protein